MNSTVTISSRIWNSFPKAFFEEIANRRDLTVKIEFPVDHKEYELTITPGQQVDTSCDYYGPAKISALYNAVEIEH